MTLDVIQKQLIREWAEEAAEDEAEVLLPGAWLVELLDELEA